MNAQTLVQFNFKFNYKINTVSTNEQNFKTHIKNLSF